MKAVIIGMGVIGRVHYEALKKNNVEIAAICDIEEDKLDSFNCVKKYVDYKEMIDAEEFDAVHICTPHYLHAEMIIYALNKNKNVLCEKPLCISRKEIGEILAAEKRSHGMLGVCLQNRYNLSSVVLKDYLKDKKVISAHGSVSWRRDESYYNSAAWRGNKAKEGGGVLINQALHTLDLLQWFCGFPQDVYAFCSNFLLKDVIEVEDTVSAVFKGNSANFDMFATTSAARDLPVLVQLKTEKEIILLTPDCAYINGKTLVYDENRTYFGKCDYGRGHESLFEDYYNCLARGEKFSIDGSEGAKVVKLILAVYESNGKKIQIQ